MSLSSDNMVLPVAPAYGGANGGFGWGSDIWLILIVLFAMGGFGGFGGYGMGGMGYEFPWLWNGQNNINANTNAGFNQAATQSAISGLQNSVTAGFGDVALGFAGVNQNLCQTGNGITNAITQSQIAAMQSANAIQNQLSTCCCNNAAATQDVKYTIAQEACADRANSTANTQAILDKLCQMELDNAKSVIDAKNDRIAELQAQVNMQNLAASQAAQTAQLISDNTAQTQYIVNRVAPYPQPAIVYGYNTSWMNSNGCGCGCGVA